MRTVCDMSRIKNKIGETRVNTQGLKMVVIKDLLGRPKKVLVRFEDGFEKECFYQSFDKGQVSNDNYQNSRVKNRIGAENINNQGCPMIITEYINAHNITVKFLGEYECFIKTTWNYFKNGGIDNPLYPSNCGVGYIGYTSTKDNNGKKKDSYNKWSDMIQRCYNKKVLEKRPTYIGCEVCERWKCYEYFEQDYEELIKRSKFNYSTKLCLDKDILNKGNKVYSLDNCVLVCDEINKIFKSVGNKTLDLPRGVTIDSRGKYMICMNYSKQSKMNLIRKNLGLPTQYESIIDCFNAFKKIKELYIKEVAEEYKNLGLLEDRLYEAMIKWEVEMGDE